MPGIHGRIETIPPGKIPNDAPWGRGMTHRDGDHRVDAVNDATADFAFRCRHGGHCHGMAAELSSTGHRVLGEPVGSGVALCQALLGRFGPEDGHQ